MTHELVINLLEANLAAGAMILVTLVLRRPARKLFGARIAYGLWALAPLALAASFLPPRTVSSPVAAPLVVPSPTAAGETLTGFLTERAPPLPDPIALDPWNLAIGLWALGVLAMAIWFARRQSAFVAEVRRGLAGPAVVGFLRPRIVTPDDFHQRFTPREQAAVLAHEAAHLARQDSRINTLSALMRSLCWFNPLVHVADHYLRIDQELACDAEVIERDPKARRPYAEALLKAQLAARPLPFGCYWPSRSQHPLTERIVMLSQEHPGRRSRFLGGALIGTLSLTAGYTAWAAQPAQPVSQVPAAPIAAAAPRQALAQTAPERPSAVPTPPSRAAQTVEARPAPNAPSPSNPTTAPVPRPQTLAQAPSPTIPTTTRDGSTIALAPGAYLLPNPNFVKRGPGETYFYSLPAVTVNLGAVHSNVRIKVTIEVDRESGVGIERYQPKLMEAILTSVSRFDAGTLTARTGVGRIKGSLKAALGEVVAPLTISDVIIEEMEVSAT